jgi:hypothetical protein
MSERIACNLVSTVKERGRYDLTPIKENKTPAAIVESTYCRLYRKRASPVMAIEYSVSTHNSTIRLISTSFWLAFNFVPQSTAIMGALLTTYMSTMKQKLQGDTGAHYG